MEVFFGVFFIVVVAFLLYRRNQRKLVARREVLIDAYPFPQKIGAMVQEKYPHLSDNEVELVLAGLREYFHLCNIAGRRLVSMPSQVVDVAWHEFILFTRKYEFFCSKALGRFLHHTPAEAMSSPTEAQKGIQRAWKISCHREEIAPRAPNRLPVLFSIDADLNISDGFHYARNCQAGKQEPYCAGHIGCSSGCGGGCAGESLGESSGGDGCGGGCGGD